MSVYIRGLEMPTDHPLWIVVHSDGTVEANEVSQANPVGWQTLRNAAVPVPPHGRLIDADAPMPFREYKDEWKCGVVLYAQVPDIRLMPTIIPAEEGEGSREE